jgi:hypothetical protein
MLIALMGLVIIALCSACDKTCEQGLKTETVTMADSAKYANLTMKVELPMGSDAVSQAIRQQLITILGERLTHVTSFEGEQFYAPFTGNTNNVEEMMGYYCKNTMSLLDSLATSDANDRIRYIMEDEELSEEEKANRIAEIPGWEYEYRLELVADTTNYIVFLSQDYLYMGGAHGGVGGDGDLTFDKETGKLVKEFLNPACVADIQPLLIEGLLSYFAVEDEQITEDELFDILQIEGRQIPLPSFAPYPTKDGLVFVYQQYEIASYAVGMPSFTVAYDKLLPYLTPEARKVCGVER